MMDIIILVFFAVVANADDWIKIEVFGKEHEKFLRNYPELPYGIPSHDTIQRVFAMVPSEFLENFQKREERVARTEEHHPDAEYHNRSRWKRDSRGKRFYQQSGNRL